ncbi:MAG: NAD-dependent epimerase/dehydratase family protein [Candidatus Micrarchaeia archaeon]
MNKITKNMDLVFYLAAVSSPPEFEILIFEGYEINVMGTYNVIAASAVNNVRRVILASSSPVYGNMIKIARKSDLKDKFENFYPLSKRINELTGSVFLNYGLEIVSLRYFNTYGINENMKGNYASVI